MRVTDLIPWRSESRRAAAPSESDLDPVGALQLDINRAFEDFWRMLDAPRPQKMGGEEEGIDDREMRVDLRDGEKDVIVTAELPGMNDADIDVFIDDGFLTIRGEKKVEAERKEGGYLIRERHFGAVERNVRLPDGVDPETPQAVMKNGVLTITIAKTNEVKDQPRHVSVRRA